MGLSDRIEADLIAALKAGDRTTLSALRLLKAAAKNAEVAKLAPLSEDEYETVLRRQVKMRREAVVEYERAHRLDLANEERAEQAVLERYLPEQIDEESVHRAVAQAIAETGATGAGDLGKVMAQSMRVLKGQADGSRVNAIARALLAERAG